MTPFYFQEVAVRRIIARIMRGQRRVLLTMATGTGKTFVAFQTAWKLVRSGWLQRLHPQRPARILFIADRIVLRDQAYNRFSSFADGTSEPRLNVAGQRQVVEDAQRRLGDDQRSGHPDEPGLRGRRGLEPAVLRQVLPDQRERACGRSEGAAAT